MTRVSITVTSHLGDVELSAESESFLTYDASESAKREAGQIDALLTGLLARARRAYEIEATPPAVKRPEWGNVALVEDLRREAATSGHPDSSFYELLYAAAERIEELSRGTA